MPLSRRLRARGIDVTVPADPLRDTDFIHLLQQPTPPLPPHCLAGANNAGYGAHEEGRAVIEVQAAAGVNVGRLVGAAPLALGPLI